jgi:hypothetical protein
MRSKQLGRLTECGGISVNSGVFLALRDELSHDEHTDAWSYERF